MNEKAAATALKNKNALKITDQFRSKDGITYDMKCEESRMSILVTQRSAAADEGEWRVQARSSGALAPSVVFTEWGATRLDALLAVGRAWTSGLALSGLPTFDWDAVAKVLGAVRAV